MSSIVELGQYILQTHNSKNPEDSMGGGWTPLTLPIWVRQWADPEILKGEESNVLALSYTLSQMHIMSSTFLHGKRRLTKNYGGVPTSPLNPPKECRVLNRPNW